MLRLVLCNCTLITFGCSTFVTYTINQWIAKIATSGVLMVVAGDVAVGTSGNNPGGAEALEVA